MDLTNNETYEVRVKVGSSFNDIEVYFLNDNKDDNPLNNYYFNEWYKTLVIYNDQT